MTTTEEEDDKLLRYRYRVAQEDIAWMEKSQAEKDSALSQARDEINTLKSRLQQAEGQMNKDDEHIQYIESKMEKSEAENTQLKAELSRFRREAHKIRERERAQPNIALVDAQNTEGTDIPMRDHSDRSGHLKPGNIDSSAMLHPKKADNAQPDRMPAERRVNPQCRGETITLLRSRAENKTTNADDDKETELLKEAVFLVRSLLD